MLKRLSWHGNEQGPSNTHHQHNTSNSPQQIDQSLPSTDRCILHLRLLAAFARLRDSVLHNDGLLDCRDGEDSSQADLRWTIYIAKATRRFEQWYDTLIVGEGNGLRTLKQQSFVWKQNSRLCWSDQVVPPLDVLMVLHSYLLNPRDFLQDCLRHGRLSVWVAGFPWAYIEENLDSETFAYEPSKACVDAFEQRCGVQWDLPDDSPAVMQCPGCLTSNPVSWTELYRVENHQGEKGNLCLPLQAQCSKCEREITQETLALARLRDDLQHLQNGDIPLPGTLLTNEGRVMTDDSARDLKTPSQLLALNDMLRSDFGSELLARLIEHLSTQQPSTTLNNFREEVDQKIAASDEASRPCLSTALKRMLARYHRNASPFALDLVGAVLRQGTFITKMQSFDWIHSPALAHTVSAAIKRYSGFFAIMAAHPKKVAVPTFDVDLVWHTHQLSPADYYDYSTRICHNVFIDHDDKIGDGVLTNSFEWTCTAYQDLNHAPYDKCLCWSCELLERAAMTSLVDRPNVSSSLTSRIRSRIKKSQPKYEPTPTEIEVIRIQLQHFERDYAINKSKAITASEPAPSKLDYYHSYTWHHPALAPLLQELMP